MDRKIICLVVALLSMMSFSSCSEQAASASKESDGLITAKVTGKEHIVDFDEGDPENGEEPSKHSYYLVYTDKEVFKIEDSLIFGQFHSSDVYGMLTEGETYKFKVFGLRIPFLSTYRNIVGVYTTDNTALKAPRSSNQKNTFIVKVTGKERVDGQYLIYTNEGTFKIEDSFIFGRFNSSEVYGMMQKGKYYRIKTFGIRSGLLSTYQNIVEVETLE